MTSYLFGAGTVIGKKSNVTNAKPAFLGTLQSIDFSIDQTIKELYGQLKSPVAIAAAERKLTLKAKFARVQATILNDMLFNQTLDDAAGVDLAVSEGHTIPATPGPYTVTVTNAADFIDDFGVFYLSDGNQLTPVTAGSEAAGKYSYVAATGVYTFAAADQGKAILIYYNYTITTGHQITWVNDLMGQQPTFELMMREQFLFNNVQCFMTVKLNACVSGKLMLPFKNNDFMVEELDINAFADAGGNIGTITLSE